MRIAIFLWIAVCLAFVASCSDSNSSTDAGLDASSDTDTDSDGDADTDTDSDSDTDADTDSDSDSDTDSDSDADGGMDCEGSGYSCAIIGTCSGTTVSGAVGCQLWEECCDPGDAGAPCPWTCEGYPTPISSGCEGIGHTQYDCGMTQVCCEPVAPDAGGGDCEPTHHCEDIWSGCGSDPIHFELSGCSITQLCCD